MKETTGDIEIIDTPHRPFFTMLKVFFSQVEFFCDFLQYLYSGLIPEKHLSLNELLEVLLASNQFSVTPLVEQCEAMLVKLITANNVREIKALLEATEAQQAFAYCEWFIRYHNVK